MEKLSEMSPTSSSSDKSWELFTTVLSRDGTYVSSEDKESVEVQGPTQMIPIRMPIPRSPKNSLVEMSGKVIFRLITLGMICECKWL